MNDATQVRPIRVLLVDDSEVQLRSLTSGLARYPDVAVVGSARTAGDGVRLGRQCHPEVVLLDLSMPDMSGWQIAAELRRSKPAPRIVILSTHDTPTHREAAHEIGATFVAKGASLEEIVAAVRQQARTWALVERRASDECWRQVMEVGDEAMWLTDAATGSIVYVNRAYRRIWGRSTESLMATPRSWLEAVHEGDRARVFAAEAARRAEVADEIEYRIIRADGSLCWIRDRSQPVRDASGVLCGIVRAAADITERRQLEQRAEDELKLEALGRLAAGIAHDLNNLLGVIDVTGSMLAEDPTLGADARDSTMTIVDAGRHAIELTRQLMDFANRQAQQAPAPPQLIDLADALTRLVQMFRRVIGRGIVVSCHTACVPPVRATVAAVDQVLLNLLVNARDAMPRGGSLDVGVDLVRCQAGRIPVPDAPTTSWVRVRVTDSGEGIAAAHLPKILEPFFTTKEPGKGTGLGLATVNRIVREHGGWIEVDSQVGAGTTFRVYWPAMEP